MIPLLESVLKEAAEARPPVNADGVRFTGPENLRPQDLSGDLPSVEASVARDVRASEVAEARAAEVAEARIETLAENRAAGALREARAGGELSDQYPPEQGYAVYSECCLRSSDGSISIDAETGQYRRVDFCVVKDNRVVDSVEVTSLTAPKETQLDKESRIRLDGGNYISAGGQLVPYAPDVYTRTLRYP